MWVHFSEGFVPFACPGFAVLDFLHNAPRALNLGRAGVVLFFVISGFVIFGSLRNEPHGSAGRRFVITRFFRLYPAYWVSLVVGLIVLWWWPGKPVSWSLVLANVTMLPSLFGQPYVVGLYWTLETELVFYALCWGLHRAGWLDAPRVLVRMIIGLALFWLALQASGNVIPGLRDVSSYWKLMPRHLAIMFWGALFRVVFDETEGFRTRTAGNRHLWLLTGLMVALTCLDGWKGFKFLWGAAGSRPSAYVLVLPFFWLWTAWLRIQPRWLVWLGRVSYSLYLFHVIVQAPLLAAVADESHAALRGWPLGLYLLVAAMATVLVSAAVYYAVELPAIRQGRVRAQAVRARDTGRLSTTGAA